MWAALLNFLFGWALRWLEAEKTRQSALTGAAQAAQNRAAAEANASAATAQAAIANAEMNAPKTKAETIDALNKGAF